MYNTVYILYTVYIQYIFINLYILYILLTDNIQCITKLYLVYYITEYNLLNTCPIK